jgi:hypothetical protein
MNEEKSIDDEEKCACENLAREIKRFDNSFCRTHVCVREK